jgi:hypothetical protein
VLSSCSWARTGPCTILAAVLGGRLGPQAVSRLMRPWSEGQCADSVCDDAKRRARRRWPLRRKQRQVARHCWALRSRALVQGHGQVACRRAAGSWRPSSSSHREVAAADCSQSARHRWRCWHGSPYWGAPWRGGAVLCKGLGRIWGGVPLFTKCPSTLIQLDLSRVCRHATTRQCTGNVGVAAGCCAGKKRWTKDTQLHKRKINNAIARATNRTACTWRRPGECARQADIQAAASASPRERWRREGEWLGPRQPQTG